MSLATTPTPSTAGSSSSSSIPGLVRPREALFRCDKKRADCDLHFNSLKEFAEHMRESQHCIVPFKQERIISPEGVEPVLKETVRKTLAPDFALKYLNTPGQPPEYSPLSDELPKYRGGQYNFLHCYTLSHPRWRCGACKFVFFTWEQLEEHMNATGHCVMRCEDCDQVLSWDEVSPESPANHCRRHTAALTLDDATSPLHAGVKGFVRVKKDFLVHAVDLKPAPLPTQYVLASSNTKKVITYPHKLLHAYAEERRGNAPCTTATCMRCRDCARTSLRTAVLHMLLTGHVDMMVQHYPQEVQVCTDTIVDTDVPPTFMYQCSECFALRSTWAGLVEHMTQMQHCIVRCSHCSVILMPHEAPDHFRVHSPCFQAGGFSMGNRPQHPKDFFVAIDRTDADVMELVDQSDDLIDPVHGPESTVRLVYQCPLETCLRCFGDPLQLQTHLTSAKHGMYSCPVDNCGKHLRVWDREFLEHDREHRIELPEKSHLAGRSKMEDFLGFIQDQDALRMFPNYFCLCEHCNMVVHPNAINDHARRECGLRRSSALPDAQKVRETTPKPSYDPPKEQDTNVLVGVRVPLQVANQHLQSTSSLQPSVPRPIGAGEATS